MPICEICGEEFPEEEMTDEGICLNCASAMLQQDEIDMGMGFEEGLF